MAGMIAIEEVKALLAEVVGLVETYVPPERRQAELDNLAAVAAQITGDRHLGG
jgi:hypothetical protein